MTMQPYYCVTRGQEVSLEKPWADFRAREPMLLGDVSGRLTKERGKGSTTVLAVAAVDLEGFLVAVYVNLDAAPGAL